MPMITRRVAIEALTGGGAGALGLRSRAATRRAPSIVRAPIIARWSRHIAADAIPDALISQVDFRSSFAALIEQNLKPATAPDITDEHAGTLGVVEGSWKFIKPGNGTAINRNTNTELGNNPSPQLYHLAKNPGEKNNLAAEHPERVKAMAAALEKIKAGK